MPRDSRKTWFKIAALAASVALALLGAEIFVRVRLALNPNHYQSFVSHRRASGEPFALIDYIEPTSAEGMVYDLIPDRAGKGLGEYFQRPIRINADGMRDRTYSIEKPEHVYRIAVLGDSLAFGWGVSAEDTYGAILEEYLNDLAKPPWRFEVLNFGIPGYNTPMEASLYEAKARKYDPDLIVIHHVANDHHLPNFLVERPKVFSLRRSFLWDRLSGGLSRLVDAPRVEDGQGEVALQYPEGEVPEHLRGLQGWGAVEEGIDRLARLAVEDGAAVAQLATPTDLSAEHLKSRGALPDVLGRYRSLGEKHDFFWLDATARLAEAMEEYGLDTHCFWVWHVVEIDGEALPERDWIVDAHPNEIAHSIIAWAMLEQLRGLGLFYGMLDGATATLEPGHRARIEEWIEKRAWEDVTRAGQEAKRPGP